MKRYLLTIIFVLSVLRAHASEKEHVCSGHHAFGISNVPTHVKDSALLLYDVHFYGIDLEVNDTSTYIKGSTQILVSALEQIDELVFELSINMTVDSIFIDGEKVPAYSHGNDLVKITPDVPLEEGRHFSTKIFYHGTGGKNSIFSGISNRFDSFWGKHVTYTLSEPFHALDWFACKQVLTDKADSAHVYITTTDRLKAGSIGLLAGVDSLPGNRLTHKWETHYPIAFYLLSMSVSEYDEYSFYIHPEQSPDSFLFQNYIYDSPSYLLENKDDIDATGDMMNLFAWIFGNYPFWQEKYGHCVAPMGGGMEHQTMTTLVNFGFNLVAHELAHQWFGDNVTCASWQDIWINEGFASYGEYLALEYLDSKKEADFWMLRAHERVFTEPEGSVYIPEEDATDEFRIFSSALSYKKGAALLHMIRYELNDDSLFYMTLKSFQEQFADSVATGHDFLMVLNEISGRSFDWFFDQWYYGQGYPVFNFNWWQTSDSLIILADQRGSSSATPFFRTSLDIGLILEDGLDTSIQVNYDSPTKRIQIPMNQKVRDVVADPLNWIVDISQVIHRYVTNAYFSVSPNPFQDELNIVFNSGDAEREIILTDINGRVVDRTFSSSGTVSLHTHDLAQAVYLLQVIVGNESYTAKVIRQ